MELGKTISILNAEIDFQTKLYGITFDFKKALNISLNSKVHSFTYKLKSGKRIYTLFPILEIYFNPKKTVALILFPDGKCCLKGSNEISTNYRSIYVKNSNGSYFTKIQKGNYVLTEPHTTYRNPNNPEQILISTILEDNPNTVNLLMQSLEKVSLQQYPYHTGISSSLFLPFLSFDLVKEKERNESINKIIKSFKTQIDELEKAKKLEEVHFDFPSPSLIQVSLNVVDYKIVFIYPLSINPSRLTIKPDETEDAHYWLQALYTSHHDSDNKEWIKARKLSKIYEGINYLMINKDWFSFEVNKKKLTVLSKTSSNKMRRYYIEGVMTREKEVLSLLQKLLTVSRKEVMDEIRTLHKIPDEVKKLLDKGIRGYVVDLEGKLLIHLKVKRTLNRYSFIVHGKEFKIKGGLIALKRLRNAVTENSRHCSIWEKLGISSSRDYRFFIHILKSLIDKSRIVEFYSLLKADFREAKVTKSKELKLFLKEHKEITESTKDGKDIFLVKVKKKNYMVLNSAEAYQIVNGKEKKVINCINYYEQKNYFEQESLLELLKLILDDEAKVGMW